ncbi:TPA: superoxide dismutase [Fe] [Candidatus Uhrbacteria bacterium]|nr:superoxide dismutase [Fe] [Candidatus Uhrbacteria bacterium]
MPFVLPNLNFEPTALKPWLSAESFSYHHGKHHATYISKLNSAVSGTELEDQPLEELIKNSRGSDPTIFNNAAQHFNHDKFWLSLTPTEQTLEGRLRENIERDFGSFEMFKEKFSNLAGGLFGSGWVWLVQTQDGRLEVRQYQNAETPGGTDDRGLLPLDVWEHTYYIDHRNDRAGFIAGFWSHINWQVIAERLI